MNNNFLKIDPSFIHLVGSKMYENAPSTVLVRELLQNSIDACVRKHVEPQIKILFEYHRRDNVADITVTDNGIGMTPDQIRYDFLTMGKPKDKQGGGQTGGFGLAKIALLQNKSWSLRTLWWKLTSDGFNLNGDEAIAKMDNHLDGTSIFAKADTKYQNYHTAMRFVYFSDVDVHFVARDDGETILDDSHAGMRNERKLTEQGGSEYVRWKGYTTKTIVVDYGENQYTIAGYGAVRINGLVQYVERLHELDEEGINLIVDLEGDLDPRSENYPMTTSREAIADDTVRSQIRNWFSEMRINARTARKRYEEPPQEEEEDVIYPGYLLGGSGVLADVMNTRILAGAISGSYALNNETRVESARLARNVHAESRDKYSSPLTIFTRGYEAPRSSRKAKAHASLLAAWARILDAISQDEYFGIGFTSWENACRHHKDGVTYYLVNPETFDQIESASGVIYRLWQLACHEIAHKYESSHNERFTMRMSDIAGYSADWVDDFVKDLKTTVNYYVRLRDG